MDVMNSWRAECARELLISTTLFRVSEPKRKKNAQISLSLRVFFFLPSLANNNTLENINARKSDRLL